MDDAKQYHMNTEGLGVAKPGFSFDAEAVSDGQGNTHSALTLEHVWVPQQSSGTKGVWISTKGVG